MQTTSLTGGFDFLRRQGSQQKFLFETKEQALYRSRLWFRYDAAIWIALSRIYSMVSSKKVRVLASNSFIKLTGLSNGGFVSSATFSI